MCYFDFHYFLFVLFSCCAVFYCVNVILLYFFIARFYHFVIFMLHCFPISLFSFFIICYCVIFVFRYFYCSFWIPVFFWLIIFVFRCYLLRDFVFLFCNALFNVHYFCISSFLYFDIFTFRYLHIFVYNYFYFSLLLCCVIF